MSDGLWVMSDGVKELRSGGVYKVYKDKR